MRTRATWTLMALATLGVVLGVLAREPITAWLQGPPAAEAPAPQVELPPPEVPPAEPVPSPEELAGPHLEWAEAESRRVLASHLTSINRFFYQSKRNTGQFAENALGWGSKWYLMVDALPFNGTGRHENYLREQFSELIFQPNQLEAAVTQVVESYLQHIESIEGEMLVRLRADLVDFPESYQVARIDPAALQQSYQQAIAQVVAATGEKLQIDIAKDLVAIIAGEVMAQAAVRLGISGGLLGAGAASSWATFGLGLAAAVVVDYVISWVWDWYADPQGNLQRQVNRKLDEIRGLIVDGAPSTGTQPAVSGLRDRLKRFANERANVRKQAVMSLLEIR